MPLAAILDFAVRNISRAVEGGVGAVYLQDLGETPHAPVPQPHTVAGLSAVGALVRREFPDLPLGFCLASHGAREPLAIAQAVGAQFVRIKVYIGAMVKSEGILQGCAYEAIQYRSAAQAEDIAILADVYDRTGAPLGRMPLIEEARQAVTFGRADGLILTGQSVDESQEMLEEVHSAKLGVPLLAGGGTAVDNLSCFLPLADGIIVSSAFKKVGGWTRASLAEEWDTGRIRAFMDAVRSGSGQAGV
jgi:membrane complex biogenesis BtpA family protein